MFNMCMVYVCVCVYIYIFVVVVQSLICVQLFVTPWTIAHQVPLPSTISWSLLKFISHIYVHIYTYIYNLIRYRK